MRILLVLLLVAAAGWADVMSVADVFGQRTSLDGKPVTVRGTVKGYYEKDEFSAFLLVDGGKADGKQQLVNDSQVTVSGTLWVVKKASSITP